MSIYDIALGIGLCLAAVVIADRIPSRGFAWSHRDARLPLVAQSGMLLVLMFGLFLGDDGRQSMLLFAGWMVGTVVGGLMSLFRRMPDSTADAGHPV